MPEHDLRALNAALLSAFGNHGALQRMLLFEMNVRLEQVAGGANQSDVIANLITWAMDGGRLDELVAAARRANPGNPLLKAYHPKNDAASSPVPPAPPAPLTPAERLKLSRTLSSLPPPQFGELVLSLNPPSGIIPAPSAPQGDRAAALIGWAEGPNGCGLAALREVLDMVLAG